MKAIIVTSRRDSSPEGPFQKESVTPMLSRLIPQLHIFPLDEVLVLGRAEEASLNGKEFNFKTPVAFHFNEPAHRTPLSEMGMLERMIEMDELDSEVLLIALGRLTALDLSAFRKTLDLHPDSPVAGVRKIDGIPRSSVVTLGDGNRVLAFSNFRGRPASEWEPAGVYYFPPRFLAEEIPSYLKFSRRNLSLEGFLRWSAQNFKVSAHVFAAHTGF